MEFHFLRPYWFFAILPVAYLLWRVSKLTLADNWRRVCDDHLLKHLLVSPQHQFSFPLLLAAIGMMIAIMALAGPSWEKQTQPVYQSQIARVIVLNLSPSMADSLGPAKKIDRARFKLLDYLNHQLEGLTGLVVYTDEAHIISPLTEDNKTIANFLPALEPTIMPTYNDDTSIGLQTAEKLLEQGGMSKGSLILMTDKVTHTASAISVAKQLKQQGYRLYIFDISAQQGTNKAMEQLAMAGGGSVISLTPNNDDIETIIAKTKTDGLLTPKQKTNKKGLLWQDNGRVLILFLLPLALLGFRRGYL